MKRSDPSLGLDHLQPPQVASYGRQPGNGAG